MRSVDSDQTAKLRQRMCSDKRRFRDQDRAQKTADYSMYKNPELFLRVYFCPFCHGFHLTKRPEQEVNEEELFRVM